MSPAAPRRAAAPSPAMAAAMSGAVDLAAVKARSEAAARAADQPAPQAADAVVEVTEASFQAEVIDRSFQVPVLIDLWADWCQPCKQLSPILEKLAVEGGGRWILAKVDTEANPRLAQAMQVQSIPTVYAVIGGQLVPGFQGALPEPQVREFVTAVLQAGQQAGLTGPAPAENPEAPAAAEEPPGDPRFAAAEQAIQAGDFTLAAQRYQAILDAEPANNDATLALRQVALLQRVEKLDDAAVVRADAAPEDVTAALDAADYAFAAGDAGASLARLIGLVKRVGGEERDRVRERIVEYFDLLGPDDPRVVPARRELARALF